MSTYLVFALNVPKGRNYLVAENDSTSELRQNGAAKLTGLKDGIKGMEGRVGSLVGAQKFNNLLTAVNTYQNYKTNKRLKGQLFYLCFTYYIKLPANT